MSSRFNPAAVVPVYNHPSAVGGVVGSLLALNLPVVLVDDGSNLETKKALGKCLSSSPMVHLVSRPNNGGKGAAVLDGMKRALELGFTHALQVDADGQHDSSKAVEMISKAAQNPDRLILGRPIYDASAPFARRFGRKLTNFWVGVNTLSLDPPDAMCGFRVYPIQKTLEASRGGIGLRMDFDPEILVRMSWMGVKFEAVDVKVVYPLDGVSHFRAFSDNAAISKMHARLFFGMLARLPAIILKRLTRS